MVSHNAQGEAGDAESLYPVISDNGQFVVYVSSANDLVQDDTNGA